MSENLSYSNSCFAPFFLGAAIASIASIILWAVIYLFPLPAPVSTISPFHWHAHQMIYGYAMAVIAGFLLTVVESWTGQAGASRKSLVLLLFLWLLARVFFVLGALSVAAVFDLVFVIWLATLITLPIARSSQWRQMAVVSKLMLLGLGNLCFYLGAAGLLAMGTYWGVYGGLYLVLGLILTMGRRLFPTFLDSDQILFNSAALDRASLLFFLIFFVSELVAKTPQLSAWFALGIAVVNGARLIAWHRRDIWKNNLLWSFYLSLWMIVLGFMMFAASRVVAWPLFLAVHAMAFGGIGLVSLSMMWRILFDHAGLASNAGRAGSWAFAALLVGSLFRVMLPLAWPDYYRLWILCSALCWTLAFTIFAIVCVRVLVTSADRQESGGTSR